MKNYYKILDIPVNASQDDIKKAYYRNALEFHPDVNNSVHAHQQFLDINEAYQTLSNKENREKYDAAFQRPMQPSQTQYRNVGREFVEEVERRKRQQYRNKAKAGKTKVSYKDVLKNFDCHFSPQYKANGTPFYFNLHRLAGLSQGSGLMRTIRSKMVTIAIPRSKHALKSHITGFFIKLVFLLFALIFLFLYAVPGPLKGVWTIMSFLAILFVGGGITQLYYKYRKTKSKFFYARKYFIVQKYLKRGYSPGFHASFSASPLGWVRYLIILTL